MYVLEMLTKLFFHKTLLLFAAMDIKVGELCAS